MDGSSFLAAFAAEAQQKKNTTGSGSHHHEEVINFNGVIDSFPVKGKKVSILPSPGEHEVGSSKLKITNIVDYGWEHTYYTGQQVATHHSGDFFAYAIFSRAKQAGVVRVVYRRGDQARVLLKGMKGSIEDMAFSHCPDKVFLAVVDSSGSLFVHEIVYKDGNIHPELVLEIATETDSDPGGLHRVIWCPYLPDEEEEEDSNSRLLVHINNKVAYMWNLDSFVQKHGCKGAFKADDISELRISDHTEPITDASFSPDGTALATASMDGQVKFFQVYMLGSKENPRCLHQWSPHGGRPVTSLFFLDNHKNYNPEVQFWKFAVTGAEHNSEIKIWSCESWECIQKIVFQVPLHYNALYKASLDLSAKYLVLSDIYQKFIYILHLKPDKENDGKISVVSVTELATPSSFLSMAIDEAGMKKELEEIDEHDDADSDDEDDRQDPTQDDTLIKMFLVNPKSLQECRILYKDAYGNENADAIEIKQEPSSNGGDDVLSALVAAVGAGSLADVVVKKEVEENPELDEAAEKITLMSPEVFVSSDKVVKIKEEPASPMAEAPPKPTSLSFTAMASGGSSPSREVQNILADSEENGGMMNDVVITEEDSEDSDYNEDAEFEGLEEKVAAAAKMKDDLIKNLNLSASKTSQEVASQQNQAWQNLVVKQEVLSPLKTDVVAQINQQLSTLSKTMSEMASLVQMQRSEIKVLREEIRAASIEDKTQMRGILDQMHKDQEEISLLVSEKTDAAIKREMKKIGADFSKLLQQDVNAKLTKSDQALRDAIAKMAHSKTCMDSLGVALATSLTPVLQASFRDVFASVVTPAFERSIQSLFANLAQTFTKGTKEYESVLKNQVNNVTKDVKDAVRSIEKSKGNQTGEIERIVTNFVELVLAEIRESGRQQRSLTATPVTPQSPAETQQVTKMDIANMLRRGDFNGAFQTALSALNLSLVVSTCEMVNPTQIFCQNPCPLTQSVLLSLIQQLGGKLHDKTEIKLKYLEEAVMNLNTADPMTASHVGPIANQLMEQLQDYVSKNPQNKFTKNMKMLLLATKALKEK